MFGKKKNIKRINEVIRLNDEAVYAEEQGDVVRALICIDKAWEMAKEIEAYQLLNWVVECNRNHYHLLYDPNVDKRQSMDTYMYLRNIVKNNISQEQFKIIKEQYGGVLVGLMSLMLEGKPGRLFEEISKEAVALSKDAEIETKQREYLQIMSSGLSASYYVQLGNYAVALHYGTMILEQIEYEDEISTLRLFYLNQLLFTYAISGQMDHAVDLGRFLYVKYLKNEVQIDNMDEIHRMFQGYTFALTAKGEYRLTYHVLKKAFEKGIMKESVANTYLLNLYFSFIDIAERCSIVLDDKVYQNTERLLEKRRKTNDFRSKYITEKNALDLVSATLSKRRKKNYIEFIDKVYDRYMEEGCPEGEFVAYLTQIAVLLREYGKLNEETKIKNCGRHLMTQLYKHIQQCQYYIDNDRMLEALLNVESAFVLAYSALEKIMSNEVKFEYILNYKNLLPTIVRYRDNQIVKNTELCEILKEVNNVKDMIAQMSSSLISQTANEDTIGDLQGRLTELGNLFSVKYRKGNRIPYYSMEEFERSVPEHSIVLDMFFSKSELYMLPIEDMALPYDYDKLECFVWTKENGVTLRYHKNESVMELLEMLEDFLMTIQDPHRKYKKKAEDIYEKLFGSCMDDVSGIETIYICPHGVDANVPFDTILGQNPELRECKIVYMQTVRELFYQNEESELTDICIVGNPSYSLKDDYSDEIRSGKRGMHLVPLPFSEYEAKSIANIYKKECYTGKRAMKNCIKPGYRMFHIATHGFSEREEVENVWYSSALSFAGIIDWMDSGIEQGEYGNGVLTADEISRMNLRGTELVVLSACNSGNSLLYSSNHLAGLHIAFAAAGVNYIVSSLWEVDDFATAVLMQLFSEVWNTGKSVEESLLNAKRKMRSMTADEIYQYITRNDAIDSIPNEILDSILEMDSKRRIFNAPYYWAGFVCYQNARGK